MVRKKSKLLKKKLFRLFKPRGIMVLVFLVVSLVATIALVTNPNISLDLRNWAASNTCSSFTEPTCRISGGCTWNPEKITTHPVRGTCMGGNECSKYNNNKKSCDTYSDCIWKPETTTIPASCSGTPSTSKTCPNSPPYTPGKHGEVAWIGDINYVCNGAVGDWIDCNNKAKLADSPFGANFECQNGGSKNQECLPPKCLDTEKLQTCKKVGVRPEYTVTDCSNNNQTCSGAKCVDKVNCDGYPKCPGDPKIRSICRIVDDKRDITPEICSGDKVCKGQDGLAKCQSPTAPPPTTYTCLDTLGQYYSEDMCECKGDGTHPQNKYCCKKCPTSFCTPNAIDCASGSTQRTCNAAGSAYTFQYPCECVNGACKVRTYYGIPPHRLIAANELCDYNEYKEQIGQSSSWRCLPKSASSTTKIPTGQQCTFNNDESCESGDCRLFNSGWVCWDSSWNAICVPNTTTCDLKTQKTCNAEGSDYTTQTCGYGCAGNACRTTPIPTGEKCASPNDNMSCQSGDCRWSFSPWGWYCHKKTMGSDCTGRETRCIQSENVLETCKNGLWEARKCDDTLRICGLSSGTTYACKQCPDPVHEGVLVYCSKQQMEDSKK